MQLIMSKTFHASLKFLSEDAEKIRMHTSSEAGDMESLEKMIDGSDLEDSSEGSSSAP